MTTEPARLAGIPVLWCRDPRWTFSKWSQALSIQFNTLEISITNQMERTSFGSVWPECLGPPVNRWLVTCPVISVGQTEMSLFISQNRRLQYRSFVSCLKEQ